MTHVRTIFYLLFFTCVTAPLISSPTKTKRRPIMTHYPSSGYSHDTVLEICSNLGKSLGIGAITGLICGCIDGYVGPTPLMVLTWVLEIGIRESSIKENIQHYRTSTQRIMFKASQTGSWITYLITIIILHRFKFK